MTTILTSDHPHDGKAVQPSVFLAGPSLRNRTVAEQTTYGPLTPWRVEAIKHFIRLGFPGTIYIPEPFAADFDHQVEWERKGLEEATAILIWVPRTLNAKRLSDLAECSLPGFTTNIEFGRYVSSGRLVYGRPEGAAHTHYMDWLYTLETADEPVDDLEELVSKTIARTKR